MCRKKEGNERECGIRVSYSFVLRMRLIIPLYDLEGSLSRGSRAATGVFNVLTRPYRHEERAECPQRGQRRAAFRAAGGLRSGPWSHADDSCPYMVGAGLEPAPMACFCDRRRAIAATAGAGRLPAHQGKRHRFGDRRDGVNDVYR